MSRDGYGRDEIPVRDDRRDVATISVPRAGNRPNHKRGGPPISGASHGGGGRNERAPQLWPQAFGRGQVQGCGEAGAVTLSILVPLRERIPKP
jgi:hypothetical protein